MNDEQLKQALKALQQEGGFSVVDEEASPDVPSVQEAAAMEPPRGDYSKRPDVFAKTRQLVKNLPASISPDENYQPPANVKVDTVYAGSESPQLTPAELRNISIENSARDPGLNARPRLEQLLRMGKK